MVHNACRDWRSQILKGQGGRHIQQEMQVSRKTARPPIKEHKHGIALVVPGLKWRLRRR